MVLLLCELSGFRRSDQRLRAGHKVAIFCGAGITAGKKFFGVGESVGPRRGGPDMQAQLQHLRNGWMDATVEVGGAGLRT